MAEKAGFEGEGEVEFRSPGKIRDARDEGFQETCRTCQDSNKTPKRHARDNEICVRPMVKVDLTTTRRAGGVCVQDRRFDESALVLT